MPAKILNEPYIQVLNVPPHVYSKAKRQNNLCGVILPTGESYYTIKGKRVTDETFNKMFPVIETKDNVNQFGENKDGKHIK